MKSKHRLYSMILSAVVFLLVSCKDENAVIGQQAPEIAAFDLQGNKVTLATWKNQNLLLTFWSESCGVCIAELKELEKTAQAYPDKLQLVAINVDGEKADTQAVVEKHRLTMPVIKDQIKITAERYRLNGTPTSFIIDKQGKILDKFEGLIPQEALAKLVNQG